MKILAPELRRTVIACLGLSVSAAFLSSCGGSSSTPPAQPPVITPPQQPADPQPQASISLFAGRLGIEEVKAVDGSAAQARLVLPREIAFDGAGNTYVTTNGNELRKIAADGAVSKTGETASYIANDSIGNIWLADSVGMRRISPSGQVTAVAGGGQGEQLDGNGDAARFSSIGGMAVGVDGSAYVADLGTVRKVTATGTVSTIAGSAKDLGLLDGAGTSAHFSRTSGIAVDQANNIFVVDGNAIRRIAANGAVTTIAGGAHEGAWADGSGTAARFNQPAGVAVDSAGNLYVADAANHVIRRISPDGMVTTLAGQPGKPGSADGRGDSASFYTPMGLKLDHDGSLLVADLNNGTIRRVTLAGVVSTVAGKAWLAGPDDGVASAARFNQPGPLAVDDAGNLYVADIGNSTVRKITPEGTVSTLAGAAGVYRARDGAGSAASFSYLSGISVDKARNVYVTEASDCFSMGALCSPGGVVDKAHLVRKISPTGIVTSLAGARAGDPSEVNNYGSGAAADVRWPGGVLADENGALYVANCMQGSLLKVGQDGFAVKLMDGVCSAQNPYRAHDDYPDPKGMVWDAQGNLYLSDSANNQIHKISPDLKMTHIGKANFQGALDGAADEATFNSPQAIAIDSKGNLYVADTRNNAIRKIAPDGTVSTVAGKANMPGVKLGALPGGLTQPAGIAIDRKDVMYISSENAILKLQLNK